MSSLSSAPHLQVTCALIVRDGRVLCAQRSATMSLPLKWEFPGGKLEPGESAEACIIREIKEELRLNVEVIARAPASLSPYKGNRLLELIPFVCRRKGGQLQAQEHREVRWCDIPEMRQLDWAVADLPILEWWATHHAEFSI